LLSQAFSWAVESQVETQEKARENKRWYNISSSKRLGNKKERNDMPFINSSDEYASYSPSKQGCQARGYQDRDMPWKETAWNLKEFDRKE